jgi:hypothetical protein
MDRRPIECPDCGRIYQIEESRQGRRACCGRCGARFVIRWDDAEPPAATEGPPEAEAIDEIPCHDEAEPTVAPAEQRLAELNEQIHEAERRDAELTGRLQETEARLEAATRRREEQSRLAREATDLLHDLQDKAGFARAEVAQAEMCARQTRARIRDQEAVLADLRDRQDELSRQVAEAESAAGQAEAGAEQAARTMDELQASLEARRRELEWVSQQTAQEQQARDALRADCEGLERQRAELQACVDELDGRRGLLSGERIAAQPRIATNGDLSLPSGLEDWSETGPQPLDWVAGLRGVGFDGPAGQDFLERIAPLIEGRPDDQAVSRWMERGRAVFVMCNTPAESARLKALLEVWSTVDPAGAASIVPPARDRRSWIAAPGPVKPVRRRTGTRRKKTVARRSKARRRASSRSR